MAPNKIPAIAINIEETYEQDVNKSSRILFTDIYDINSVPENFRLSISALANNEVTGITAESFVRGLFYDMCFNSLKVKWVDRYFPNWKKETENDKQSEINELLDIQRRIKNGEYE